MKPPVIDLKNLETIRIPLSIIEETLIALGIDMRKLSAERCHRLMVQPHHRARMLCTTSNKLQSV